MSQHVSLRQYARHRGCTLRAVQKAIEDGRVPESALLRKNNRLVGIDPVAGDIAWARNTDPDQAGRNGKFYDLPPETVPVQANLIGSSQVSAAAPAPERGVESEEAEQGSLLAAKTTKEQANAALAQIELQKQLGVLCEVAVVQKAAFAVARVVRDAFMLLPDRLAQRLAMETDPGRVHADLETEIRFCLNGLADRLPAAVAEGPG